MNDKITLCPKKIQSCIKNTDTLLEIINDLKNSFINGSDFEKMLGAEKLFFIKNGLEAYRASKDLLRIGALIGINNINQCENSLSFLPKKGFVNNYYGFSQDPSDEDDLTHKSPIDKMAREMASKLFSAITGVAAPSPDEKDSESKEQPDFVKDLLDKIESGELS